MSGHGSTEEIRRRDDGGDRNTNSNHNTVQPSFHLVSLLETVHITVVSFSRHTVPQSTTSVRKCSWPVPAGGPRLSGAWLGDTAPVPACAPATG